MPKRPPHPSRLLERHSAGLKTVAGLAFLGLAIVAMVPPAAAQPGVTDRGAWGAKAAITKRMKRQTARSIVIHHTSVRQQPKLSLETKLRGLQSYSQRKKGWGDSPYYYYIGVSGRIGKGRDDSYAGDSNTRYNTMNRIQVVLEGHFDREQPNSRQVAALKRLVGWLSRKYGIPGSRITGHNDHAATDCPGRNLKRLLPAIRRSAG